MIITELVFLYNADIWQAKAEKIRIPRNRFLSRNMSIMAEVTVNPT
jgi:hypothetical protein